MRLKEWLTSLFSAGDKLRRSLLARLFRSSTATSPKVAPAEVEYPVDRAEDAGNYIAITRKQRSMRLMCSDGLRIAPPYRDWIAPLAALPKGASVAEIGKETQQLTGSTDERWSFFPLEVYAESMPKNNAEWVHYCIGDKKEGLAFPLAFIGRETAGSVADEKSVLVIHDSPAP